MLSPILIQKFQRLFLSKKIQYTRLFFILNFYFIKCSSYFNQKIEFQTILKIRQNNFFKCFTHLTGTKLLLPL